MSKSVIQAASKCLALTIIALSGSTALGQAGPDTGPAGQRVPWRAAGSTLNSVVQVANARGGLGSGSVVCKHIDAAGDLWVGVLTADHVARPGGFLGGQSIFFGDGQVMGPYGGAGNSWYRQFTPAGASVDMALVAINMGPNNAVVNPNGHGIWHGLTKITPIAVNPQAMVGRQFTELGYGLTGTFVAGGMNGIAGVDNNKRFQNNQIESVQQIRNAAYQYDSLEWHFDRAAAAGFLVAEGLSFVGDSGGPYLMSGPDQQMVAAFARPGHINWAGGMMPMHNDFLFAVHTYGNSVPNNVNAAVFNPYTNAGMGVFTFGGGVPITPHALGWINAKCHRIPTPATAALLMTASLVALRRRR